MPTILAMTAMPACCRPKSESRLHLLATLDMRVIKLPMRSSTIEGVEVCKACAS
jgi:hypothetical protein